MAAVVAVLESEEYDDAGAMSRRIVQVVAEELAKRDAYGVGIGLKTDDLVLPHGPYYTQNDAKRAAKQAEERGLRAFIAPLLGTDSAVAEDLETGSTRCAACKHPKELHGVSMTTYTGKPKPMTSLGCCVFHRKTRAKCDCTGYTKE